MKDFSAAFPICISRAIKIVAAALLLFCFIPVPARATPSPKLLPPMVTAPESNIKKGFPMASPLAYSLNAGYKTLDSKRTATPLDPTLQWSGQEVVASDGEALDGFGYSVAITGNTVVVGPKSKFVGDAAFQGAAYLYQYRNGSWSQTAELIAPDGGVEDEMGWAVAAQGDTMAVAAPHPWVNDPTPRRAESIFIPCPMELGASPRRFRPLTGRMEIISATRYRLTEIGLSSAHPARRLEGMRTKAPCTYSSAGRTVGRRLRSSLLQMAVPWNISACGWPFLAILR